MYLKNFTVVLLQSKPFDSDIDDFDTQTHKFTQRKVLR